MSNQVQYATAAVATVGALGGAYYAYSLYKDHQERARIPTQWTKVGTLSDMYAYPVKSVGPVVLETAEVSVLGLKDGWLRDRVLMVVDEKMNFVTARAYPELLTVQPIVRNSVLTLKHSEQEDVHVNLAEVAALQETKTATVWGVQVPVYDCGYEPSEWFSRLLAKTSNTLRLVYYASQNSRVLRPSANPFYRFTKKDTGAFPDEVAYNLINQASVDELNTRLADCQVTHRNFRPNFVLQGAKPYDEDNWKFVKIGEHVFEIIKPCTRCIMTTIDPETGVRNTRAEPLETLKSYRQISNPVERKSGGSSPRMGLQMALRSPPGGRVKLSDAVYVA
ncbi:hypothetical protein O0L34_g1675 [Tuta absoluta]|nr:hypothetical protein O0L34_g1675 [Tuta absoluta]